MLQPFSLDPDMLSTIGKTFYPTGYSLVMFPDGGVANTTGERISTEMPESNVFLLEPATILREITPTVSDADNPLPSAGTEGATVRAYTKLALDGHHGLLVETPDAEAAERMMEVVRQVPYSMAQRYRALVIEDL